MVHSFRRRYYLMKHCMYCGEGFEPRKIGTKYRFCSKICANKHIIRTAKARRTR